MFGKQPRRGGIAHSYPFLTHDTLRVFTDWDLGSPRRKPTAGWLSANRDKFQDGDSIFLKTDHIHTFATTIDPVINKSYVLITGNSAYSPTGKYNPAPGNPKEILALLDSPRLLRWFAQNPGRVHHKLEALPVGLENSRWGRLGKAEVMAEVLPPQVRIYH